MATRHPSRPGVSGAVLDAVEQWSYVGLGAARTALQSAGEPDRPGRRRGGRAARGSRRRGQPQQIGQLLPGAVLGLTLTAQHQVFDAVAAGEVRLQGLLSRSGSNPAVAAAMERLTVFLAEWDARFRAEQDGHVERARAAVARLAPAVADAILAELDVDALLDQVDLDAVVDRLPVDRVIDRVNLREILIDALIDIQVAELLQGGTLLATSTLEALRELGGGATRLATRRLRLSRDGDPAIRSGRTSEPVAGTRTRRTTTPRKRS